MRLQPFLRASAATLALVAPSCGQGPTELVVGSGGSAGTDAGLVLDGPSLQDVPVQTSCKDPKDSDGDGIADELELAPNTDTDGDATADYLDDDSDNDTWLDKDEAANPWLPDGSPGKARANACSALADTDGDGIPDVRDVDSDGDGIADADEKAFDPDGSFGCRVKADCDNDGVVDPVEVAAGSSPTDATSVPPDATLYFVLPCQKPERTKDFDFSTGVKMADIYFLVDTTNSMQAAIDNVASTLDSKILPAILNGDPTASPAIPAIPGAWIGVGDFRDIPWAPWGATTDELYRSRFPVGSDTVLGNVSAPEQGSAGLVAPQNVRSILAAMKASGGGDSPEGQTQAMWIAATGLDYAATGLGFWKPDPPSCTPPGSIGTPCFRPGALPLFVLITDAPMHNGPVASWDYTSSNTGGTHPYQDTVDAINGIGGKVLGVSVNTGTPGAAREDMKDLATKTASLYHDDAFGGHDYPLVTDGDTATGDVSDEVVRLIGLLAGQGLHNVTTAKSNYDCDGTTDCNGDGNVDPAYHNATLGGSGPFDASQLIIDVEPVASTAVPKPYADLDATTFYGVRGDASVTFKVHAQNTLIKPSSLVVLRAMIRVQTPGGQQLGGPDGVKVVYLVIPRFVEQTY